MPKAVPRQPLQKLVNRLQKGFPLPKGMELEWRLSCMEGSATSKSTDLGGVNRMKTINVQQPSGQLNDGRRGKSVPRVPSDISIGAAELRDFAACLLLAQEAEQRRISREIHDDLGQRLALLEIQVEKIKRTPASESKHISELESLRGNVAELAEDLHRICHRHHPVILDNLGLAAGIESLCEEHTRTSGIDVNFVHGNIFPAPADISLCLYRVVQEALHNVAKHSSAKRATVTLCGTRDGIQVIVCDVGCGFDLARRRTDRSNHGLGLISIGERVRLLGGRYEIRSQPGRGTHVMAFVPFAASPTANVVPRVDTV
jgi:signal transduction histidine kinase